MNQPAMKLMSWMRAQKAAAQTLILENMIILVILSVMAYMSQLMREMAFCCVYKYGWI